MESPEGLQAIKEEKVLVKVGAPAATFAHGTVQTLSGGTVDGELVYALMLPPTPLPLTLSHHQRWLKLKKEARKGMTKQEKVEDDLRETFDMYDIDGSGAIDISELRLMTNELCIPMTEDELNEVPVRPGVLHALSCTGHHMLMPCLFLGTFV